MVHLIWEAYAIAVPLCILLIGLTLLVDRWWA